MILPNLFQHFFNMAYLYVMAPNQTEKDTANLRLDIAWEVKAMLRKLRTNSLKSDTAVIVDLIEKAADKKKLVITAADIEAVKPAKKS